MNNIKGKLFRMRTITAKTITQTIKKLCLETGINIDEQTKAALKRAYQIEENASTKFALDIMIKNAEIAKQSCSPLCQDTGVALVFAEIGQDLRIVDGYIEDAMNEGVRQAYTQGFFRKSMVDPITRINTLDNTPAVIHYSITKGDELTLSVMPKGFGSENMCRIFMLSPAEGVEGVKNAIIRTVSEAGSNPCPPVMLGVGIGGTMEKAALLSKKALLRDIDSINNDDFLNQMERELEQRINELNIGAQGLGGKVTALRVLIEKYPTHIAGLPVAITVQCHAVRHKKITL